MSVEIEYPLPGCVVGRTFDVGGEYNSSEAAKRRTGDPPPDREEEENCTTPVAAAAQVVVKVVCTVFESDGTTVVKTLEQTVTAIVGFWNFSFTLANDHSDCKIKAWLTINGLTNDTDQVEDVDVLSAAGGDIAVEI